MYDLMTSMSAIVMWMIQNAKNEDQKNQSW